MKRTPEKSRPDPEIAQRGPLGGIKLLTSPYRKQVDQWLFVERLSVSEVERRCKEQGWDIGRRTLSAYLRNVDKMKVADSVALPGVVMVDHAEESVRGLQRVFRQASRLLEEQLLENNATVAELVQIKKLEMQLYGAQNIADFTVSEEKWRKAILAVAAAVQTVCSPEQAAAIMDLLRNNEDWIAVMPEVA